MGLVLSMLADPISFASVIVFTLMGATVSEALVTFFLVIKTVYRKQKSVLYYDDGTPARFFITGDKYLPIPSCISREKTTVGRGRSKLKLSLTTFPYTSSKETVYSPLFGKVMDWA